MVTLRTVFCKARHRVIMGTISALFGVSLLVGCGYKGPLYLPPPPDTLGEQTEQRNSNADDSLETSDAPNESLQTNESLDPPLEPNLIVIE
ncbi:MAG: lipoprotein [Orrella sp.]